MRAVGSDGFSLAELLVSLAVVGLTLSGAFAILHGALHAYSWGAARVEAQQSARVALERIARELREAGYDPTGAGIAPIAVAASDRVTLQSDLNRNGIVDATSERVTFLVRAGERVLRRDAGAGAQPIAENVRRFHLTYFEGSGAQTTDASRVASVRVDIEVGGSADGPTVIMQTDVAIRNRRGN
jgi:prepilin-type N-terminal cleavage/methylation domain-containing protein